MCGIVGISAHRNVVDDLIHGLKALEYRGYDSAGLAVFSEDTIQRHRAKGKVAELAKVQQANPVGGHIGIAHTRWATHGVPSERNAHPHVSGDDGDSVLAVVHNGIIENHAELRAELEADGYTFHTDTDTEVVAHLIERAQRDGCSLTDATRAVLPRLEGAFALVLMSKQEPDVLVGTRLGSPLVLGIADNEHYLASDTHALISLTRRFIYLEEGDLVTITPETFTLEDANGDAVTRTVHESTLDPSAVQKGGYPHFMLKEIHEQPKAVADTLEGRIAGQSILSGIFGINAEPLLQQTKAVHIVACGTSFHAGSIARYWIEALAGLPCTVEVASEYRYRSPVVQEGTLFLTISQSGETLDSMAALKLAHERPYLARMAVCNVPESSIVRASDLVLMTRAGPEIGVASTKAFTTQLAALALLALTLAHMNGMDDDTYQQHVHELTQVPGLIREALLLDEAIKALVPAFVDKEHALFLGRGTHYPVAMEGALKLKEISYIHAEAYAAGELKHGPLALVDADMPVVAVAPNDHLIEKLRANMEEVHTRGGRLYLFVDEHIADTMKQGETLTVPTAGVLTAPIVFSVPLQLLAYHVAVARGTDVDQPRNLAKSVTVE